jgi:hypothetical protein
MYGERDEWKLLSPAAAQQWLERSANHLVEKYFGKMPEVAPMTGPFPVTPFLIKALADVVTGGSNGDLTPSIGIYRSGPKLEAFFLDCGL